MKHELQKMIELVAKFLGVSSAQVEQLPIFEFRNALGAAEEHARLTQKMKDDRNHE